MAISRGPIEERSLPNWTMDFATIDPVEAGEIIGDPGSFTDGARVRLDSLSANRLIAGPRDSAALMELTILVIRHKSASSSPQNVRRVVQRVQETMIL